MLRISRSCAYEIALHGGTCNLARQTSIATYHAIRASGVLSRMRLRVYDWRYTNGEATRSELDQGMKSAGEVNPSYHKRLSELERMGLVSVMHERPCKVTGRVCMAWETTNLTNPLPLTKPKNKSKRVLALEQLADQAITELEVSCDRLASDASVSLRATLDRIKG